MTKQKRQHTRKCKTGNFTTGKKKTEEYSKRNNSPVKFKITKTQQLTANQRYSFLEFHILANSQVTSQDSAM